MIKGKEMEIGSEFWKKRGSFWDKNVRFYLSGRTALDVIAKDAIKNYGIKSVLLPSYCCHTMIMPFYQNKIAVRFYDIYVDDSGKLIADIPLPENKEMLYIMKYFGDTDIEFYGKGKDLLGWEVTVEDMTHSCFCAEYETGADYWFVSYRKWFAVDGIAIAGKKQGFLPDFSSRTFTVYNELRNKAFEMKQNYMEGEMVSKETFLDLFSKAEEILEKDYIGYGAAIESVIELNNFYNEIEKVKMARRKNVVVLQEGLKGCKEIKIFSDFDNGNKCPLFLPVLVSTAVRDKLRKFLIDKGIYCPVHWPVSNMHQGITERAKLIYGQELSLVCDQRYGEKDMERIVNAIKQFMMGV